MNAGRVPLERVPLTHHDSGRLANLQEMYGTTAHEQSLGDYWRILQKRKWTVIVSVIVVVVAAALISFRMTPIYDATARISISQQPTSLLNFKDGDPSQSSGNQQQDIDTQVKIMQSDTMAELVIHRLALVGRPEFAGSSHTSTSGGVPVIESDLSERSRQEKLIHLFLYNLKVQQIPATTLVDIRYSSPDASLAAEIANATATTFIEQNIKARYDTTMQAADWLSKQLADLQIKVESSQSRLIQYEKQNNIVGADDKHNLTLDKLDDLNKQLTEAQAERMQKESIYQIAQTSAPDSLTTSLQDPLLVSLRQQRAELNTQYALLTTQFGAGYTKVAEIKNQIDEVDRAYGIEVENSTHRIQTDYQAALKREQMLQSALEAQTRVADQLNENAIEYKALKQEADANRQLYDGLLQRLKEASLAAGLDSSNIRIVDRARVPLHPARPKIPLNMEFAVLIGLVGGIAVSFALDALDTTVGTPDEAETISGLPTLGLIPMHTFVDPAGPRSGPARLLPVSRSDYLEPLISYLQPQSEIAEAYRTLRTSILLSSVSQPPHTILVTSSVPQDGKTMTSVNIAVVLAQQGRRILLLDADMRRPTVHKIFGISGQVGLSSILTGGAKVSDAVYTTVQSNLFVIPGGPIPPHPSELLGSALMQDLLGKWRDAYDHVIIDTPPVIAVTDAVMLSAQVDAVLLVIRSGQTTAALVRRTRDLLRSVNANILGLVVNAADLTSPDYYNYYYKSKYGYYTATDKSNKGASSASAGVESVGPHDDEDVPN